MPQHVDAGDGRRHTARRDGTPAASRRCRRHRGVCAGSPRRRNGWTARARDSVMPFPKMSPVMEALTEKGFFDRLPVTFSTFFYDQIQEWELLFPAEQSYYERFFGLLDKSEASQIERLFEGVREAERKMGVTDAIWPKRTFTLQQVDFLNRSAHYPEWRKAVSEVFANIDPLLDAETARHGRPRIVMVLSPAEIPVSPNRLW